MLLVDHLPQDTTRATAQALLAQLGAAVGLKECQMVPSRPGLAFLEYESIAHAAAARNTLDGRALDTAHTLTATFAAA